jgi:hypothetical protein
VRSPRSARHRADRVDEEADRFDQVRIARDHGAADQVGVATDVLRHAVHDDVGAQQ